MYVIIYKYPESFSRRYDNLNNNTEFESRIQV